MKATRKWTIDLLSRIIPNIISKAQEGMISGGGQSQGGSGGVTFTPSVSSDGVLSWTNNGNLENPESVDIASAVLTKIENAEEERF